MSGPHPDPQDPRLLNPEWDTLFGFMIGRLLSAGYTPAQIQVKCRFTADLIRKISGTFEGQQVAETLNEGYEGATRLVEEELDGRQQERDSDPS